MSALLTGNLPLIADAPEGIRTLRGLILELAVRGKLVPQDPNEEPASELLKRIAVEKGVKIAHRCAQSVFRDLPPGWSAVSLNDYAKGIFTGPFGSVLHKSDYVVGGVPLVNPSHMRDGRIVADDRVAISQEVAARLALYRLAAGDIVMARRGEVGRAAIVHDDQAGWLCGTGSFFLKFSSEICREFLIVIFRGESMRSYLAGRSVGTTMVNLNHGILKDAVLAIPPLAEQHRIVAKVDELMALCDRLEAEQVDAEAAHAHVVDALLAVLTRSADAVDFAANWHRLAAHFDTLFTTEAAIDALKQTVLQLAVMGKLVPQSRNDVTARELLDRISAEKNRLTCEEGLRTTANLPPPAACGYMPTPIGWEFERLGNLAKFIDYRGRTPRKTASGIPLITAKNVRLGFISREPREYISETEYTEWMTRGLPRLGDLLFTTEAPLGNVALVDIKEKFALAQRVICLQLHEPRLGEFLRIVFLAEPIRREIEKDATGMTASGIKATRLKEIPVPIPPIAEQERIVAKVDELMALCDRLKADLASARERRAALADTLIAAALEAA